LATTVSEAETVSPSPSTSTSVASFEGSGPEGFWMVGVPLSSCVTLGMPLAGVFISSLRGGSSFLVTSYTSTEVESSPSSALPLVSGEL